MKKLDYRRYGELVQFASKDKTMLTGFLMEPKEGRRDVCLIHVHGMTDNFYGSERPFSIGAEVSRHGIVTFSMNTRGHDSISVIGKTPSRRSKKNGFLGGTSMERFEDCLLDIDGAISAMRKRGYNRFILSGHSTSCQKVTYYQYKKQNRKVIGIILLSPADDYNSNVKKLGRKHAAAVKRSKELIKMGNGGWPLKEIPFFFSPKRFLSVADLRNVEARLFNYDGEMREFSAIKTPVCVFFGSKEQYAVKPVREYMRILKEKSGAEVTCHIIKGARHSFRKHEKEVSEAVARWAAGLV